MEEFLRDVIEIGIGLNQQAMVRNIDQLTITIVPELEYVRAEALIEGKRISANRSYAFPEVVIKEEKE